MGSFEMYVSGNGKHIFTTEAKSLSNAQAYELVKLLMDKFPKEQGFSVVCLRWERVGSEFTLEELAG